MRQIGHLRDAALGATLITMLAAGCASRPKATPTSPPVPPGPRQYMLAWSDEFDGNAGDAPDSTRWVHETGGDGWGNNELEFYTGRTDNSTLDGAGHLVITAKSESFGGRAYTSARLKTQGRFAQRYGRFEARVRLPTTSGIWPAFWMLGDNIGQVGWPNSGEIDILELIGKQPNVVYGTAHGGGTGGHWSNGGSRTLPNGSFSDDFHVFAVTWTPDSIQWSLDGVPYHSVTPNELKPGQSWAFDHPFFLLLNVAVGGNWPGSPDATATFPQQMTVDYVRVYKLVE